MQPGIPEKALERGIKKRKQIEKKKQSQIKVK